MINEYLLYAGTAFASFFAIMNPFTKLPIFLGMVDGFSEEEKQKVARTSILVAFTIVVVFIIFGKYIFEIFHIGIPGFKIAGGLLLFYIGFEMLLSKKSEIHQEDHDEEFNMEHAVSPLAIPILAGPGTIVTAMNNVTAHDFIHVSILIGSFAAICLITFLMFTYHKFFYRVLGKYLILVIGKIMGLLITIIGAGMVVQGIKIGFNLV